MPFFPGSEHFEGHSTVVCLGARFSQVYIDYIPGFEFMTTFSGQIRRREGNVQRLQRTCMAIASLSPGYLAKKVAVGHVMLALFIQRDSRVRVQRGLMEVLRFVIFFSILWANTSLRRALRG